MSSVHQPREIHIAIDVHTLVGPDLHRILQGAVRVPKVPAEVVAGVRACAERGAQLVGDGSRHIIIHNALPTVQTWIVGDEDHCVRELCSFIHEFGMTDIVTMAVPPGLRAEQMQDSLERLFRDVIPRVKAEISEAID